MKKYYIQLFSPHGLIRSQDPEIGRDKDTGGQVKYVLELLQALSNHEKVRKVDLFTRQISDKRVSRSYTQQLDIINDKARIVRINCGGNSYKRKELLWRHLDEFIDKTIRFNKDQEDIPDIVHGHYADGNYIARRLSEVFGIPFFSTAHSLGRNKKKILLAQGLSAGKIDQQFNIEKRIREEELSITKADAVIASTSFEIASHYKDYESYENARFKVIPPGINEKLFYPFYRQATPSFELSIEQEQALYRITSEIDRFLFDPNKPLILSIGRPDRRKNFETIIEAFGKDKELQTLANLALFAGVRKDISKMEGDEQEILTNLLLLMDKYDLYGKLAIPKKNDPRLEIPEIYRLAARKGGVFVNATPGENFGLTVVEAAACGLPVIASPTGGPKEILEKCENGLLIDVEDPGAIAKSIKQIVANKSSWESFSNQGVKGVHLHYSWKAHTSRYLDEIEAVHKTFQQDERQPDQLNIGRKLTKAKRFFISDLDGTLLSEEEQNDFSELNSWLKREKGHVVFGIATGRNKQLTQEALQKYDLPAPDIIISSAGSELYYTNKFIPDTGWESHISYRWNRDKLKNIIDSHPKVSLQEENAQWKFKLSYYVDNGFNNDDLANIHKLIDDHHLKANVLLTDNLYLDFLPYRASKGNALKYLSFKWKTTLGQFITAGNGGNDIDMIRGKTKGIVVSNYSPEMEQLKKSKRVYFASQPLIDGVMEGIRYYEGR